MFENLSYEKELWSQGLTRVAGVDEVGRGCIAGPLVTAAVIWPKDLLEWTEDVESEQFKLLIKIRDSKKVTKRNRNLLSEFIKENCLAYSIVEISPEEIDANGVGEANKKALREAIFKLDSVEHAFIDHFNIFNPNEVPHTPINGGDNLSISISAASIIAKVYRDNLMETKYHESYPLYGFNKHVGYGTKAHIEAVKKHGLSEIHRKSFKISLD